MHLDLKPYWQRVRDDLFGQILAGNWHLARRNFLERLVLLLRRERMHPGHEERAYGRQAVLGDFCLRPVVILARCQDEFDFVFQCMRFVGWLVDGSVCRTYHGMPVPRDGGPPVGYAIVDPARRVRYATLDPDYVRNAFEVGVIAGAVS